MRRAALAARLAHPPERLEVIALVGPATADAAGLLAALGAEGARDVVAAETSGGLPVLAWLAGKDLWPPTPFADREAVAALALPSAVAIRVYLHVTSRDALAGVPAHQLGPVVTIPAPSHKTRAALLLAAVGPARCLEDIARDFRLDRAEIARIGAAFPNPPTREDSGRRLPDGMQRRFSGPRRAADPALRPVRHRAACRGRPPVQ